MTTHIALLRAINVGGRSIAMPALCELFAKLGFPGARSLLQSGNVVFQSAARSGGELERLLEAGTRERFGLEVDYVVRSAKEWEAVVAANPFPADAKRDPGHLLVVCMKHAPKASDVSSLQVAIRGREVVRARGQQLYCVYPDGVGRSKLTLSLIEKSLGTRGTGRNWNTVLKLAEMSRSAGDARPAPPKRRSARA